MRLSNLVVGGLVTAGLLLTSLKPAPAVIIGSFNNGTGAPAPFIYKSNGAGAATFSRNDDARWSFNSATGLDGLGVINATFTVAGMALGPVIGGIQEVAGTFSIIRDSDGKNILSGSFTGVIVGIPGTDVGNLLATDAAFPLQFADLTSDFLIVNDPEALNWTLTLPTGVTFAVGADGDFVDFTAATSGDFTGTAVPLVPEPGAMALLVGVGVSGSLLGLFRRRRK